MSTFSVSTVFTVSETSASMVAFSVSVLALIVFSSSSPFPSASPVSLASSSVSFFSDSSVLVVSMLTSVVWESTSSFNLVHSAKSLAFSAGTLALDERAQDSTAAWCLRAIEPLHLASLCLCNSRFLFLSVYFFLIYSNLYLLALSFAASTHFF
jgi:hypothetical protein